MVPVTVTHQIRTKHSFYRVSLLLFIVGSKIRILVISPTEVAFLATLFPYLNFAYPNCYSKLLHLRLDTPVGDICIIGNVISSIYLI
jgi:hypothetical protein